MNTTKSLPPQKPRELFTTKTTNPHTSLGVVVNTVDIFLIFCNPTTLMKTRVDYLGKVKEKDTR